MTYILIISIIVALAILVLSVGAISKGYNYKHTVDPLPLEPEKKEHVDHTIN